MIAIGGSNLLQGGLGDDILVGGPGSDIMQGRSGNDYFYQGGGNNLVNGGAGIDTAVFGGSRDSFSIVAFGSFATVSHGEPRRPDAVAHHPQQCRAARVRRRHAGCRRRQADVGGTDPRCQRVA
jgi:hypothetical protein